MRIFLSTSFSDKVDPVTRIVLPEYRQEIEALLAGLRTGGHDVFAAIEDEDWMIRHKQVGLGTRDDIEAIDRADAVLALLDKNPSAGVQWEIGYANGIQKKVFAIARDHSKLAYWNQGLAALGYVTLLDYDPANIPALAGKIA